MSRIACFAFVISVVATQAAAQPPHPDCAKLPNGGKIQVETPGLFGPPACQCGLPVPSNAVLGFSDGSRQTCEFKVNGQNTGQCKADTTCAPGTTRVQQNGVWGCQAPPVRVEVSCPAPPPLPAAAPPPGLSRPPSCVDQLRSWEARLTRGAQETQAEVNALASAPPEDKDAAKEAAEAVEDYRGWVRDLHSDVVPLMQRRVAACGGADSGECDRVQRQISTADLRTAQWASVRLAFKKLAQALKKAVRLGRAAAEPAAARFARDLEAAEREANACVAEVERFLTARVR